MTMKIPHLPHQPAAVPLPSFVADLGDRVLRAWERINFSRRDFPAIAESELSRRPPGHEFTADELIDWIVLGSRLPFQQYFDSPFGQPPVTLYWHSNFYIEALFWNTATPAVHNHGFCGAFSVWSGSSLQTLYDFATRDTISEALRLGCLSFRSARVLCRGDTQAILPRERFIHSVYHLDSPSVTLVVRTHSDPSLAGSFEYLAPFVAFDSTCESQERARRLQCLSLVLSLDPERYFSLARDFMRQADLVAAFLVLRQATTTGRIDQDGVGALAEIARARWGEPVDRLLASCLRARLQKVTIALRQRIAEPHLRFLVGLLGSQCDVTELRRQVLDYAPGRAADETIAMWLGELTTTGGLRLNAGEWLGPTIVAAMERSSLDVDTVSNRLRDTHGVVAVDAVASLLGQLAAVPLLRPLFTPVNGLESDQIERAAPSVEGQDTTAAHHT